LWLEAKPNNSRYPHLKKYLTQKVAGREAQVVECLHSKYEALSSNPSGLYQKSPMTILCAQHLPGGNYYSSLEVRTKRTYFSSKFNIKIMKKMSFLYSIVKT
jgi:hypothetical protein